MNKASEIRDVIRGVKRNRAIKGSLLLEVLLISAAALAQPERAAQSRPERRIVVSIPDRKLALLEDGEVKEVYIVAVGKASSPSPAGSFKIVNRVTNPTYYHEGKVISGAGNPVGTRWMGLSEHGYGIHGTNVPSSIGKAASHGCIRMARRDLEELFELMQAGDAVEIRAERDELTASLFNTQTNPAANNELAAAASPHSANGGPDVGHQGPQTGSQTLLADATPAPQSAGQ